MRPVVLTNHAIAQGRARAGRTADEIAGDVRRAIREGRASRSKPVWLVGRRYFLDDRWRNEAHGVFVWNAACTVAYVVVEGESSGRLCWRVLTVLVADYTSDGGPTAVAQAMERAGLVGEQAA